MGFYNLKNSQAKVPRDMYVLNLESINIENPHVKIYFSVNVLQISTNILKGI